MLSLSSVINLSSNNVLRIINFQTLRWRRKPRWLPTAKSKLYKIPVRPKISEDEKVEIKQLYNNYRNNIKSIRRYIVSKYVTSTAEAADHKVKSQFEIDFEECNKINDKWNSVIAYERENYFKDIFETEINTAKQNVIQKQQLKANQLQEIEKIVEAQKKAAKTFITPDNIDAAIEHALSNPVDYNYAIDIDGNKYKPNNL